jgi:SAM-dependent methyltransferase
VTPAGAGPAGLFDAVAATYDAVGVDFFQPIAGGLVAAMDPRPGQSWLDIGCGTGAVLLRAAERIAPGPATGLDISAGMVERALGLAAERGLRNVDAVVSDASQPDLGGRRFDAVSACLVLFFLPEPEQALRAWRSLLEPGGQLGVTTFGPQDPRWRDVDEVFMPFLPPAMLDARASGSAGPFGSDDGMEALLMRAGLEQVRTVTTSLPVHFDSVQQWHDFTWSTGQRAMWQAVPQEQRGAVRAEAERRLTRIAGPDGSIDLMQGIRHTLARRPWA